MPDDTRELSIPNAGTNAIVDPAEDAEPYPLLRPTQGPNILQLIQQNLGTEFSILNLQRIKMPSGESLNWLVQTMGGDDSVKELEGFIVAWRGARIFWKKKFGMGAKRPPDCSSKDGYFGEGDPGGSCKDCPNARFGTALNPDGSQGSGQACKDIRQLLILRPGEMMPHLLSIPPTSLKPFLQYSMSLVSAGVPYWGLITRFTLERAHNEGGIAYAKISFRPGRRMNASQLQAMRPYHQHMAEILKPAVIDASAYEEVN